METQNDVIFVNSSSKFLPYFFSRQAQDAHFWHEIILSTCSTPVKGPQSPFPFSIQDIDSRRGIVIILHITEAYK